ncbi:MAG: branched-chain amino acid ABC transporter substrate-binding protein [Candidatus Desantisbacteria bacterium]
MKRLLMCLVLGVIVFTGCTRSNVSTDQTVIKIGLAVPLTGDIAAMGQGMKNAAMMAINEANESGRIPGTTLVLVPVDDQANPTQATNVANQLVSDSQVIGVVGHLNSGCSLPVSKIYARHNIAMITPASTNPAITKQGLKNVFRVCTTDDVQGSFAANLVYKNMSIKQVAIIHDKTQYGQGLAEQFQKQFESNSGKVLCFEGISVGDKDFKAILTKIKGLNPGLIYFGGMYSESGLIAKQTKEVGLTVKQMGGDGMFTPEYIKIGGESTEGNIVTMIGSPPEELSSAAEFIKKYKTKYPGVDLQPYDAYTYDAVNILINAISHLQSDKRAIIDYIAGIKYEGVIGQTTFDENGDTKNKMITAYVVKNGKFEVLK